jgi:hypothetical protein
MSDETYRVRLRLGPHEYDNPGIIAADPMAAVAAAIGELAASVRVLEVSQFGQDTEEGWLRCAGVVDRRSRPGSGPGEVTGE